MLPWCKHGFNVGYTAIRSKIYHDAKGAQGMSVARVSWGFRIPSENANIVM